MEMDYDQKFAEMKKYIPFLDLMIKRLAAQGRQAQLDKIRSLRDLLMDKKKRMKMENLLKCEQVLINLYSKVEQKSTLPGISARNPSIPPEAPEPPDITELDVVRTKLKTVVSQTILQDDTLPEIARLSETEEICSPGSKEPALFQRRPNKASKSPSRESRKSSPRSEINVPQKSKRNYTRVLKSPDPRDRSWKPEETADRQLFSRRSPRRSPKRTTSGREKEKRKKREKSKDKPKTTIGCGDNVSIDTLEDIRKKIIVELKHTRVNEDISDLILQSYKLKGSIKTKKDDVEDGEISDSESEAIESIYGSLSHVDEKERTSSQGMVSAEGNVEEPRKIQISFAKNPDKEVLKSVEEDKVKFQKLDDKPDDDVSYVGSGVIDEDYLLKTLENKDLNKPFKPNFYNEQEDADTTLFESNEAEKQNLCDDRTLQVVVTKDKTINSSTNVCVESDDISKDKGPLEDTTLLKSNEAKKLNFGDEMTPQVDVTKEKNTTNPSTNVLVECDDIFKEKGSQEERLKSKSQNDKIPLLNSEPSILASIEILQELKNDILSKNVAIPGVESTPALHQPTSAKVADAKEITKRTISIENYKKKKNLSHEDIAKKQSLKLTEKECERFLFPAKLVLQRSDEQEVSSATKINNLGPSSPEMISAPKSPEGLDQTSANLNQPIIIPVEPVSAPSAVVCRSDVDMRVLSPKTSPGLQQNAAPDLNRNRLLYEPPKKPLATADPRLKKDFKRANALLPNPECSPGPNIYHTPSYTPLENDGDRSIRKNVYAPMTGAYESSHDSHNPKWESGGSRSGWEQSEGRHYDDRHSRSTSVHRDGDCNARNGPYNPIDGSRTPLHHFGRSDCPRTPIHSFGRDDYQRTPNHQFGRSDCLPGPSFGRSEMPMTPSHPFGRSDAPMTPSHPFGRSDAPMTPSHPFGRSDAPMTPSHPFGRSDAPMTPSHPFGRSDAPMTPNHPFGRSDAPMTPNHPFGRGEIDAPMTPSHSFGRSAQNHVKDPRLNRSTEYEDRRRRFEHTTDRGYYDRRQSESSNRSSMEYQASGPFRSFGGTDKSFGRNEPSPFDFSRDVTAYGVSRESEWDTRNRRGTSAKRDLPPKNQRTSRESVDFNKYAFRAGFQRAQSIGRTYAPANENLRNSRESMDRNNYGFRAGFQRAQSIGRTNTRQLNESRKERARSVSRNPSNTLSVESQSGRSFVIDTSVNSTFQQFLDNKGIPNLECSTQKNLSNSYSPRKNIRDPRMRREHSEKSKYKIDNRPKSHGIVYSNDNIASGAILGSGYGVKNYKIPKIKKSEDTKSKESPTEVENKEVSTKKVKVADEKQKSSVSKIKPREKAVIGSKDRDTVKKPQETKVKTQKTDSKMQSALTATKNKKMTRSRSRGRSVSFDHDNSDCGSITKHRRFKKAVIESDSDDDVEIHGENNKKAECSKNSKESKEAPVSSEKSTTPVNDDLFDKNFAMEYLDSPADPNVDANSLMANINALIEDLDKDLNTKSDSPINSKESMSDNDSMLEGTVTVSPVLMRANQALIASSGKISQETTCDPVQRAEEKSNTDIESVTSKDVSQENLPDIDKGKQSIAEDEELPKHLEDKDIGVALVSTTESDLFDNLPNAELDKIKSSQSTEEPNTERCSTPDSTINTIDPIESQSQGELPPNSAKETANDMNPDITSTRDLQECKACDSDAAQPTSQIESIGNLLTILQNKSKIKELLSMLGDQSTETEKIKKKLEKLSEIVSDDENDGAGPQDNEHETGNTTEQKVVALAETTHEKTPKEAAKINATKDKVSDLELNSSTENDIDFTPTSKKTQPRKAVKKAIKKRKLKGKKVTPATTNEKKRVTRSGTAKPKVKSCRELKQLQESIKEMFIKDDILNATGIRMCRLAKLVDGKTNQDEDTARPKKVMPMVVLEKFKEAEAVKGSPLKVRKKPGPKPKPKPLHSQSSNEQGTYSKKGKVEPKLKPGPKTKSLPVTQEDSDPFTFETDSMSDITTSKSRDSTYQESSDSESESLVSSQSFEHSEPSTKKKIKRKRRGARWQSGIATKKKKKVVPKPTERADSPTENKPLALLSKREITIPDKKCFIDLTYCFDKNVTDYECRLCNFSSTDIVKHYKKQHPHSEIPLSRLSPAVAQDAINQSAYVNFQAISKVSTAKYVCRFCFQEFVSRKASALEEFFWHVVSMHTGEYKQLCPECINVTRCPFNLDIPPPPKDVKGQLIGYICEKCNFTQISLENLKTHVTVRHNDEQTSVSTINLANMSKKMIKCLMERSPSIEVEEPRKLRSSYQSAAGVSDVSGSTEPASDQDSVEQKMSTDDYGSSLKSVSKISFEEDLDNQSDVAETSIKIEEDNAKVVTYQPVNSDIFDYPHFKISCTESGAKEYVCCVNGKDNHFKTTLLISMKKHVQMTHTELWDGYCFICKVIVTTQGGHLFKECLQHYVEKHIDSFPLLDATTATEQPPTENIIGSVEMPVEDLTNTLINVRPITELMKEPTTPTPQTAQVALPKIQSIISLGDSTVEPPLPSPSYPETVLPMQEELSKASQLPPTVKKIFTTPEEIQKYEEVQAEIMSKKHHVVLQTMMSVESLVRIYKCAGRFCSFTSNSAEAAWSHASTHQRYGGENAMICSYCDFDSKGNASDLVTHVFKMHGSCQFTCGVCFYRAAASQLVQAHINRVHAKIGSQVKVLEYKTGQYPPKDPVVPLSRELAVKYYVCVNDEANCKYKTFIQEKFLDHLTKHGAPYMCQACTSSFPTSTDLVQHLKSHSMNLYQCTWCIHGSENEVDLLGHASARHPNKQPQAYVRTINSKDLTKQMVLPLAKLNKANVRTQVVKQTASNDDPVREAERSIELEKLIGTVTDTCESNAAETVPTDIVDEEEYLEETFLEDEPEEELKILEPTSIHTPRSATSVDQNLASKATLVLKTEPLEHLPVKEVAKVQDIICLDSDDDEPPEETTKSVIDVSDDDAPATIGPIASASDRPDKSGLLTGYALFRCAGCSMTAKTLPAFKRHINVCASSGPTLSCAHCTYKTKVKESLYIHYACDHGTANREVEEAKTNEKRETRDGRANRETAQLSPIMNIYICGMCDLRDKALSVIKNHLRSEHKITNLVVTARGFEYTVRGVPTPTKKPGPKRKLSGSNQESSVKRVRYSLQELDRLPVKQILEDLAYCAECEFSTKVRSNLVRHLQQHAEKRHIVPHSAPVNPVPHLESNEKHFDKMVNLASSSIEKSRPDKPENTSITTHIPPEATSRYPRYVPDRLRHTCGAKSCSYISLDQAMFKRHWEALHDGINDYHCVHCPPYQQLDTSSPLTAARIIGHLKMHDVNLYACSSCSYYHHKRNILEKHLSEVHKGSGKVMIVREESIAPAQSPVSQPTAAAPTMDLKPWQCGICKFKSLLRAEVIEHCTVNHNSKMQFKCPNCPFRGSTLENVSKHKAHSHPGSAEDVFYYYYQEGSIPDDSDGTPRWQRQRQRLGNPEPDVKNEAESSSANVPLQPMAPMSAPPVVDLTRVKKEIPDPDIDEPIDSLCARFGQFCDPNGLKYKCPLCKVAMEDSKDVMQSHLFEELKYRKWGCSICSYKAFHKRGLNEHMFLEHRQRTGTPLQLPVDNCVEKWVAQLLDHQSNIIQNNKEMISKQKISVEKPISTPSVAKTPVTQPKEDETRIKDLEQAFGRLGSSKDLNFCCPKCEFTSKDEAAFKNHLETELNKIRWRCSNCSTASQNYHEAQLHCKTCSTATGFARPVEAIRDPSLRSAWVATAIRVQKLAMNIECFSPPHHPEDMSETPGPSDNSLLVVRYEETVPTPEEEMLNRRKRPASIAFVPSTSTEAPPSPESDDERLVIDEPSKAWEPKNTKRQPEANAANANKCQFCEFTSKYPQTITVHSLRHYDLKPFSCSYCPYSCYRKQTGAHHSKCHPDREPSFFKTELPEGPPKTLVVSNRGQRRKSLCVDPEERPEKAKDKDDTPKVICLVCEKILSESEKQSHIHRQFGVKGQVVVKCCICLALLVDLAAMQDHHNAQHPSAALNYAFFKLQCDKREILICGHCNKRFKFIRDLKAHHNVIHSSLQLKYESKPFISDAHDTLDITDDDDIPAHNVTFKKLAKKSTSKLPTQIVAKKSTTRLPFFAFNEEESDSDSGEEFSFYGSKPEQLPNIENVTTVMPASNAPMTFAKLKEIIPIEPKVVVKDVKDSFNQ